VGTTQPTLGIPSGSSSPRVLSPRPRVVLIFQDGLDAHRLLDPRARSPVASILPTSAVALMNPVVLSPHTAMSEYATLGARRRIRRDGAAGPALMTSATVEGDPVSVVYRRRTGFEAQGAEALHPGVAPLLRAGGESVGALAEECAAAGRTVGLLSISEFGF